MARVAAKVGGTTGMNMTIKESSQSDPRVDERRHTPFSELRDKMSPEAQERVKAGAKQILKEITTVDERPETIYLSYSTERGFYRDPDGFYVTRADYDRLSDASQRISKEQEKDAALRLKLGTEYVDFLKARAETAEAKVADAFAAGVRVYAAHEDASRQISDAWIEERFAAWQAHEQQI
jgi:hypothetical protein